MDDLTFLPGELSDKLRRVLMDVIKNIIPLLGIQFIKDVTAKP